MLEFHFILEEVPLNGKYPARGYKLAYYLNKRYINFFRCIPETFRDPEF